MESLGILVDGRGFIFYVAIAMLAVVNVAVASVCSKKKGARWKS